ncbi:hypothetical protein [Dyadobacter arcticus]|uniref:Prolyl-tRNA synthetase n=1 Tax=Dyadobacter arcticus TaxID=1078754 RepID=A0ABX0UQ57_9BACT|nr:hypothetical protein [Dyadobacter arcticus]NIJ53690.1 hypothetical protein [Dyadobacter arcticus]
MSMINKAKYLSLFVLLGALGCTSNQYVSRSAGGYDDLYGGNPSAGVVSRDRGTDQEISRSDNPDYAYTGDNTESGTSDYYDESYLSSRSVNRAVSNDVGYNAGFVDGYNRATANANPYYGGLGSYWPGSSMGFQFGFGNGFRMRPYLGFGMGSMMMGMGYSPWGYNSMMGYGSMLGYGGMMGYGYDPFGYNSWGYSPYGYGSGYYDSFYGGYGYSPWAYSRPVIVVNNNYERGISRTYGPRVATNGRSSRTSDRYNSNFVNSPRSAAGSGDRSGRRSGNTVSANDTYASPRSDRSYSRGGSGVAGGRTSSESISSKGASEGNNVYYSRPRSASASTYTPENNGGGSYSSPRSSRGSNSSYNSPAYSAPARSQSDYSAPSRGNYSAPNRSESYSAPSRTYSAPSTPSYSAPSRSYSAPSSGSSSGGGGATRSSSRGPR